MENRYLEKYRSGSQILNPVNNAYNDPVIPKDAGNLKNHLRKIRGDTSGQFYDPVDRIDRPSKLLRLKEHEKELQNKWEKYVKDRLAIGDMQPTKWPEHLEEERLKLAAQVLVCQEEIDHLTELLEKAEEKHNKFRVCLLTHPRDWSTGRLHDGVLCEIGPWQVAMNEDKGVLCIMDEDSPFNGMEVWKFKSQVTRAMGLEYRHRQRQEEQAFRNENRGRKDIQYPEPPSYDSRTGNIEYPASYSPTTIKKIKHDSE